MSRLRAAYREGLALQELARTVTRRDLVRRFGFTPQKLASLDKVNRWMDTPSLVDQQIDLYERTHTWMSLRLLSGFDLEEFLRGSRHAYLVTSDLLQAGKWDDLSDLVNPVVLESMEETFAANGHPYLHGPDGNINILSAVLSSARTSGEDANTAHMQVSFRALQGVTLHDLQFGDILAEVPRLQESTWSFEAVVPTDDELAAAEAAAGGSGGGSGGGGGGSTGSELEWQVTDIEWKVWEMADPYGSKA